MEKMANKPVIEFKSKISGGLKLTAWGGERGLSWQFRKSYKDKKTGEWKETNYLSAWDLDALISLCAQAKEYLSEQRLAEKGDSPREEAAPAPTATPVVFEDDDIPF